MSPFVELVLLARRDRDRVRLATRNGSDFTARYFEWNSEVEARRRTRQGRNPWVSIY
jgi:hypothetical protein